MSQELFNKIHRRILPYIYTDPKYIRKTCCRGDFTHIDSKTRLSVCLKHLAGSTTHDIQQIHGISRSSVVESITWVSKAIIQEYLIEPFPFNDTTKLNSIVNDFKRKSKGELFEHVVGAIDGYLLRINKRCIGKKSGIKDPSKFYCRKSYYAINCQVCCDAHRRVLYVSMMSPGAVPDTLAHVKGSLHRMITQNKLPRPFHFVGDNAYPEDDQMLTSCTRCELRKDVDGKMDNYNFYLSQLSINIECCFGMMVNKFPILLSALKTTKLATATRTFMLCCILHNLCIDERLLNQDVADSDMFVPPILGYRYTQNVCADDHRYVLDDP